ncbi:Uncharacterized protein Adt_09704 [Abeliophyllum distichum]|uniref:Uncharacterized protein n=1 Tax=Abeliophyllum distichum TaxID=126358 RepID=A0ABD1UI22_9LAMI
MVGQRIRPIRIRLNTLSVQGLKSFSSTHYDQRDPDTQQWPGIIESFRTFHTLQDAIGHDKLVEAREETQQTQVASSGVSVDERAIAMEHRTLHEEHPANFAKDARTDDHRFALYETLAPSNGDDNCTSYGESRA